MNLQHRPAYDAGYLLKTYRHRALFQLSLKALNYVKLPLQMTAQLVSALLILVQKEVYLPVEYFLGLLIHVVVGLCEEISFCFFLFYRPILLYEPEWSDHCTFTIQKNTFYVK